jgi:hypothetical protein
MGYKLRIAQNFDPAFEREYMELEASFARLEREAPEFPKGRRYTPYVGGEGLGCLIWEADFETMEDALAAKRFFENDDRHEDLYRKQAQYIKGCRFDIYRSLFDSERGSHIP